MRILPALLMLVALCVAGAMRAGVDFAREVLPILSENCFTCHGPDPESREAQLRLDLEAAAKGDLGGYAAIVAGHPEKSEIITRIHAADRSEQMPPPKAHLKLSDREKDLLGQWIREGAEWGRHWSFDVPQPVEPPGLTGEAVHPVDAFILDRLRTEQMTPAPEAPPVTLIRRLSLDLNGLPPTLAEVEAFVEDYRARGEAAYEALVDRLLESPRYGETMALPWLDAARFADTDGYQFDGPRHMWRWRDWVIEAYNRKLPFDQFTVEQLAGDLLPDASLEQRIATGFNRNHRYNSESGLVTEEFLLENAVDRVDTTSTLWMGLTMGCARCHDHKYDPISTKDYYQLIAFFNSVPEGGRAVKQGNSEPWIHAPTREQAVVLEDHDRAVAKARAAMDSEAATEDCQAWAREVAAGRVRIDEPLVSRGLDKILNLDGPQEGTKTVRGEVQYVPGVFGQAAMLDGKTLLELGPAGGKLRADEPWSVTFWVKPELIDEGVVLTRQASAASSTGLAIDFREGHLRFTLVTRWVAGVGLVETVDKLEPDRWVHVAVTADGTNRASEQKIYLDGVEVPTRILQNTNSNNGGVNANAPVRLGGGHGGAAFTGLVDQIRFYGRALLPSEVHLLSEPVSVASIANKTSSERSPGERTKLRGWYLEHADPAKRHAGWVTAMEARDAFIEKLPTTMVMKDTPQPKETHVRLRGVYNSHGEKVSRDVPAELPAFSADLPRNRLGLARWLVSGDHPLTARVAVNRYWQRYFGTGLVKTAEDFGLQGEYPSHPELLDWLAVEFVRTGWDVAGMQRLLVTSKTYRQESRISAEALERDPENRLLARGARYRLPAHVIRDQALHASGLLVERLGGPSVSPYQPANLWIEMSMGMKYKQSKGGDLYRRSLYTIWKRTVAPPAMAVFDAADREACWVRVKRTNTPLQALTLLNETAYVESARKLGERLMREGGGDPVGFGFQLVSSRVPSDRERSILAGALASYRSEFAAEANSETSAAKLIAIGESAVASDLEPSELAAHAALANVLLNLDEVISRE